MSRAVSDSRMMMLYAQVAESMPLLALLYSNLEKGLLFEDYADGMEIVKQFIHLLPSVT